MCKKEVCAAAGMTVEYKFVLSVGEDGDGAYSSHTSGSGGRAAERRTVNRGDGGSIPPIAISKLRQFR